MTIFNRYWISKGLLFIFRSSTGSWRPKHEGPGHNSAPEYVQAKRAQVSVAFPFPHALDLKLRSVNVLFPLHFLQIGIGCFQTPSHRSVAGEKQFKFKSQVVDGGAVIVSSLPSKWRS